MTYFVDCIKTLKGVADDVVFSVSERGFSISCSGGSLDASVKLNELSGAQIITPEQPVLMV